MNSTTFRLLAVTILLLSIVGAALAQSEEEMITVSDAAGTYQVTMPGGWTNASDETIAHFISPDEAMQFYVLTVSAEDDASGIAAALPLIIEGFSGTPVQSNAVTLPNGQAWTQHIYALPSGEILAIQARAVDGQAVAFVQRGTQQAFGNYGGVLNETLFSIESVGSEAIAYATPDYANPEAFTERDFSVVTESANAPDGAYTMPGTLTLPVGDGPFPAVVLVHGSGPSDQNESIGPNRTFQDIAWGLASNGIAVLRYDKRTFVYGGQAFPTGEESTVYNETIADALSAVNLLRDVPEIDPARIYVAGHSLGASIAPEIGAADPEIAGLILLAGTVRPYLDLVPAQYQYLAELDGTVTDEEAAAIAQAEAGVEQAHALTAESDLTQPVMGLPAPYVLDLYGRDVLATAQNLDMPMLILNGERDYQVPMTEFALWQEGLSGRDNVAFASYPALNHMFLPGEGLTTPQEYYVPSNVPAEVIEDIAGWIAGQ